MGGWDRLPTDSVNAKLVNISYQRVMVSNITGTIIIGLLLHLASLFAPVILLN